MRTENNDRTRTEEKGSDAVALYHQVFKNEGFDKSAEILVRIISEAEKRWPSRRRLLYLDIEGHRNANGGFDNDMLELQQEYIVGFLLPYIAEAHLPLISVANPNPQRRDVPERVEITDKAGPGTIQLQ